MDAVAPEDIKAKALIRRAALASFAERGFAGTSIRAIAARAKVSPGLIQHHFHSKDRLRAAVDDFVLGQTAAVVAAVQRDGSADPAEFSQRLNAALAAFATADPALLAYLRRTLLEGGPPASRLFDGLMTITASTLGQLTAAGLLRADLDHAWAALHILMINIGPVLLQPLIDPHLDQPLLSSAGIQRWQNANAALALRGILFPHPQTE